MASSRSKMAGVSQKGSKFKDVPNTSEPNKARSRTQYAYKFVKVPPLDFSFCQLATLDDCESDLTQPRNIELQTCWQKKNSVTSDSSNTAPNRCKYPGTHLKLNNNGLKLMDTLKTTIEHIFLRPNELTWLDVSFNEIDKIHPDFTKFKALKILYLHGNYVDNIKEIHKLAQLPLLRKLTLHGNPIEEIKFYRSYVLSHIPTIITLDFSDITRGDRANLNWYCDMSEGEKRNRKRYDY